MSDVDGFVAAAPTAHRAAFRETAERAAAVAKGHGALPAVERWGDDAPGGEVTSFPRAVKSEEGKTPVFFWIVWPSREARDAGSAAAMAAPRTRPDANPMPFDGHRLIHGGFEVMVKR